MALWGNPVEEHKKHKKRKLESDHKSKWRSNGKKVKEIAKIVGCDGFG